MTKMVFTEEQRQAVLVHLDAYERQHLADPVHGFNNPFRRQGVPATDIAWALGFLKEGETKSGRQRVDTAMARQLLADMVKAGMVEMTGAQRTLACGSKAVECYALAGFGERLAQVQNGWLSKGEHHA